MQPKSSTQATKRLYGAQNKHEKDAQQEISGAQDVMSCGHEDVDQHCPERTKDVIVGADGNTIRATDLSSTDQPYSLNIEDAKQTKKKTCRQQNPTADPKLRRDIEDREGQAQKAEFPGIDGEIKEIN